LSNGIGAGPFLTKPIRVSISVGFQHRIERQQMQGLVSSIDQAGNSERTHRFAVRFRYMRTMLDGKHLVGWGMATATYPGMRSPGAAKVRILQDGSAMVSSATQDMGGGTYTTMT
jgi:CO/xanthine dehydrogenase Mo-binding subunit